MKHLLRGMPQIFFDADGAGAGGGSAPAGGAAATPSAGSSSSQNAADATPGAPPSPPGAAEGAAADGLPAAAPSIYRPEGLPDHMLGANDQQTIDNMKKALDGYRTRDADAKIPDDPKAYSEFSGEVPETIKVHLETLKGDPLFERMSAKALEHKMSVPAYQAMVQDFLSVSAEMGLLEPPIDTAAEKAALVPEYAKHLPEAQQTVAREKRMNENFAYVDQMVAMGKEKGGLSKEAGDFAKAMLGDSARGHEFIEFLRAQGSGGHKGPAMGLPGAGGGNDARAELSRRSALPENTPGSPKFDKASHDALQADYQRLIG
ncbi:hypothetical protein RvVAT039_02190 [Agrobacterium vitis]|uniref:hypothetical protein n=1 Tax=Agrobacterium vitis TaxID=373 RepID=UPI0015DB5437|nr:hypothetical protein [Agrobacterium vitis]BCH63003.1 hypothetical protein RvVAT039_02190 [Agrobacterium vitis]